MNTPTATSPVITQEEALDQWLYKALTGDHQIAIWRTPKTNSAEIILDQSGKTKRVNLELDALPQGFIVHPFADQEDGKAYFLEASEYVKFEIGQSITQEDGQSYERIGLSPSTIKRQIRQLIRKCQPKKSSDDFTSTSKERFIETVQKCIEAITEGHLSKVVPARIQKIHLNEDFDVAKTFLSLCKAYPDAFINFFHIPNVGTWLGATPEILIKTEGNYFQTMALAGTQKAEGEDPVKNAAWKQKEIEEQAMVSRYIVNNFKKIRLREYEENGPRTVKAGNLLHLRSDFRVDMEAANFPQLGSTMLKLLHPTSAVCGTPREASMKFIYDHEQFDRCFFAGFIGPVNIEGQTAIYVNLRTAQFINEEVLLYAGAGVTADSIPEKEWEETTLKCDIIGKFIQ
ncbi:isochorismate synthase [Echinicola strongylocentroti]|uniref:isochorismate synthase n=2 Tax=Echinicola strongylocentroti TaxID=1795355 RepID=A0A2Z4IRD0_9BACT|nr:isochorismate synthase [Echinicola strongylocentroti]